MKKSLLIVVLFLTLSSCETKSDCDDLLCNSPIPFVTLKIADVETGENLFANGTYTLEDVKLFNQNDKSILVRLDQENNLESAIGDIVGNNAYRLIIEPNLEILITTVVKVVKDDCCSSTNLESFNVLNFEFERTEGRIYTIFIN